MGAKKGKKASVERNEEVITQKDIGSSIDVTGIGKFLEESPSTQTKEDVKMAEETKTTEVKKTKKLGKAVDTTTGIVTMKEKVTGVELSFDFNDLPEPIQAKLGPFGLGHKLGDAAAGKEGQAAIDAINKVWKGLSDNDWSVRAPAGEKVSKKSILDKLAGLSEAEQEIAKKLLDKLGLTL